jgi:Uma2 family endonuclease
MSTELRSDYYISPEDYLVAERASGQKHEYLAGVIYAMAGGSAAHNRIAANIVRELGNQLQGRPCEAFGSDMQVRIQKDAAEFYYYPDATIDCAGVNDRTQCAGEPRIIFEVLSPDTERVDRAEKLRNYQRLTSLDAYVLVDQFHIAVTVYRRTGDGWVCELLTEATDALNLPTVACRLSLASVYERTHLVKNPDR